jgi:hypothetical protein
LINLANADALMGNEIVEGEENTEFLFGERDG